MAHFVDAMLNSFPDVITIPEPLVQYFEWIEANGLDRNFDGDGYKHALVDPVAGESCIYITPVDPDHARHWLNQTDVRVHQRLAPFCRTGGDGSYAALWLDDAGETQIVHLGSGSGSILTGIMVAKPVDFLRLLAIGYEELCWGESHALTPEAVFLAEHPDIDDYDEEELEDLRRPAEHAALKHWVRTTFAVDIPDTASAIMPELPSMDADHSDDAFWRWTKSVAG
jgi:hypothetical protein